MSTRSLVITLTPMLLNASIVGAVGIILPHFIPHYGLSLNEGGFLVGTMQGGGFVAMLIAGFFLDRQGPRRVLYASLFFAAAGGLILLSAPPFLMAAGGLVLLGMSSTVLSTAINAMMAMTGSRRAYYLGVMHATYSFMSILAPIVAGVMVAAGPWNHYYRWVAFIAIGIFLLMQIEKRIDKSSEDSAKKPGTSSGENDEPSPSTASSLSIDKSLKWWRITGLWTICLGVFFMAGSQTTSATWVYSFMQDVYEVPHATATTAASLFWVGVLSGRISAIPLSGHFREKSILLLGIIMAIIALLVSWVSGSWVVAMIAILFFGFGTSGAFQLGTSWAVGLLPERVGTASSVVIAGAFGGGLVLPALTAMFAEHYTFSAMRWVLLAGFVTSGLAFAVTGLKRVSYSNRSVSA